MEGPSNNIHQRLVNRVRKDAEKWIRAFERKKIESGIPPEIVSELEATATRLQQDIDHFIDAVADPYTLTLPRLEKLLELLPPDRALARYDLERLTKTYDEICMDVTDKAADLFAQAEAAIDREDYDIGLNVLRHTMKLAPRYFPGFLVLGYSTLVTQNPKEGLQHLERSLGFLPHEHGEHFRQFVIELIAKAHEMDNNHSNAVKSYRRLQSLGMNQPAIDYAMARNLVLNGQKFDALHIIQSTFPQKPEFFSFALVDPGFANVQAELIALLNETRSEWSSSVEEVFNKLLSINEIVVFYGLDERFDDIKKYHDRVIELQSSLGKTSNSDMQALMSHTIPELVPDYPNLVEHELDELASIRREEISQHNKQLLEQAEGKQRRATMISIYVWVALTVLLFLILLLSDVPFIVALMVVIGTMPFGFVPVAAVGRGIRNRVASEYISASPVRQIKGDFNDVHWTKSDILGRISKEGWT